MKYLISSIFLIFCLNANAQIDNQYLINNWTKVHTEMLDGSRYISADSNKFEQLKITDSLLITLYRPQIVLSKIFANKIYFEDKNGKSTFSFSSFNYEGTPYQLEDNNIKLSPNMEYQIKKLTKDTLVVIELLSKVKDKDKIRKFWFINTTTITNQYKSKLKNDSILLANENCTPQFNSITFLNRIEKYYHKFRRSDLKLIGNIVVYPKLKKVEFKVKHVVNNKKYIDGLNYLTAQIEQSYSDWDLTGFEGFEQIEIPCFIIMNSSSSPLRIIFFPKTKRSIETQRTKEKRLDLSKQNYRSGLLAFKKKSYEKAIDCFEKSYELNFENLDALYNIATCYSLLGDQENTCKTLQKLKDLGQTDGTLLFNQKCKTM